MSDDKRFIDWNKFNELKELLHDITEQRGLFNKLEHLYLPDTDMNDKVCEDIITMKKHIVLDISYIVEKCKLLVDKVLLIKED